MSLEKERAFRNVIHADGRHDAGTQDFRLGSHGKTGDRVKTQG
jgi:hypothetical protein